MTFVFFKNFFPKLLFECAMQNVRIGFQSGEIIVEQTYQLNNNKLEGLLLHQKQLKISSSFKITLSINDKKVVEGGEKLYLPTRWDLSLLGIYDRFDKIFSKKLPIIGDMLENILPDAVHPYDLWYSFSLQNNSELEYKIHFGPWAIADRFKLEGIYHL